MNNEEIKHHIERQDALYEDEYNREQHRPFVIAMGVIAAIAISIILSQAYPVAFWGVVDTLTDLVGLLHNLVVQLGMVYGTIIIIGLLGLIAWQLAQTHKNKDGEIQ